MAGLLWELVPIVLGVILSPLAIIALIAVLLSRRAVANGVAYLLGWSVAVVGALAAAYVVFGSFDVERNLDPPQWVAAARLVFAGVLFMSAVWIYRRAHAHVMEMAVAASPLEVAQAAPQLPGWLQRVEHFSPPRSCALGLGIFVLNPVNLSCAIIAALDIRLADIGSEASLGVLIGFAVLGIVPMAVPVVLTSVKRERAEPTLAAIRTWSASHNNTLSIVLLVVVGFLQVQKAIDALF